MKEFEAMPLGKSEKYLTGTKKWKQKLEDVGFVDPEVAEMSRLTFAAKVKEFFEDPESKAHEEADKVHELLEGLTDPKDFEDLADALSQFHLAHRFQSTLSYEAIRNAKTDSKSLMRMAERFEVNGIFSLAESRLSEKPDDPESLEFAADAGMTVIDVTSLVPENIFFPERARREDSRTLCGCAAFF